jgi:hypothetical protein
MRIWAILALLPLAACANMKTTDFKNGTPSMALEDFFQGNSTGYGMFIDRFGDVRRQFKVAMHGQWNGSALMLDEDFTYDDGERQQRHWVFRKTGPNDYEGTAGDVIGISHGHFDGSAYQMHYTADVKQGDSTIRLDFNDWLFRQSDAVVLNNSRATKLGVEVGQVQLVFVR